jgi:hypothetical protein
MEKQRWEESGKRKEEERKSKNRKEKTQAREKVEKPITLCFTNVLSKSRLANVAATEPSGCMREELRAVAARSTCGN